MSNPCGAFATLVVYRHPLHVNFYPQDLAVGMFVVEVPSTMVTLMLDTCRMPECISPLDQPWLPLDLYLPILNHVQDQNDLFNLSRVSSEWHAETNLVLYRHVTILSDHKRQQIFFRTVTQDHSLALLVEELTVEFCQPLSSEETQIVQGGLQAMQRLENLSLHCTSDDSIAQVLLDLPFQLRRFSWISVRDQDEELVLQFLSRQTQIQDLEIFLNGTSILSSNIPAWTCPRLSVLRGSRASIDAFLPDRRITTLAWLPEFEECCDPLYDLYGPFSRLRILQLGGKWMRPRLTLMAEHLSALEVLELVHIWVSY